MGNENQKPITEEFRKGWDRIFKKKDEDKEEKKDGDV